MESRTEPIWEHIGPPVYWAYARYIADAFVGETGVSGSASETATERFCNEVASGFLLAEVELRALNVTDRTPPDLAQAEITAFARPRRVSRTMVAYRLLRSGAISHAYWQPLHQTFRDL